jgi:PBP1b-binding outer membrane lipoprotein LpoB
VKKKLGFISIVFLIFALLLAGCSDQGKPVKVTKSMNQVISNYILKFNTKVNPKTDKQFEAHKIYGAAKKYSGIIEVYLYYAYEEFNRSSERQAVNGGALPVRIKLKKTNGTYKVVGYKEAEDGSAHSDSIRKMFPKEYAEKALNESGSAPLQKEIDVKVVKWLKQ